MIEDNLVRDGESGDVAPLAYKLAAVWRATSMRWKAWVISRHAPATFCISGGGWMIISWNSKRAAPQTMRMTSLSIDSM